MARHPYKNFKAFSYARQYCGLEANSCGKYFDDDVNSDCAHFLAHCLAAGGIVVRNTDPKTAFCPDGLAIRNTVIEAELRRLAVKYENVAEIDLSNAIVGDVGFLQAHRPLHAFMVCEIWDGSSIFSTPKVWAHSTSRCCEEMDTNFKQWFSSAYRLEDG